jgi:flagellar FliL protein
MILIAAGVGALVVLGGGGTAAVLMLGGHKTDAQSAKAEKPKKKAEPAKGGKDAKDSPITEGPDGVFFYAMTDQTANIQSADGRPTFLKLKLSFETPDRDTADAITPDLPRLNDMFQTFLRELRPEDLSGSQGAYQLRMELQRRVNLIIAPAKINGVLIQEMLIQ